MRLIVGLGNPGPRYRCTRHNVGFRCLDLLAQRWEIPLSERRPRAVLGRGRRLDQEVVLAKPRTFMNNSGEAVRYLLDRFGVRPHQLLVIYDDVALPVGKMRLRPDGSDGGHNGMRSIIGVVQTTEFPRLRVGVGQPPPGQDQVAHVLGRFNEEESPIVAEVVQRVPEAVHCILEEGMDAAMNRFN